MKVKKILFFANGDPRNASTWSNVSCCFVKELERRGIDVVTIDLTSHPFITKFYDLFLRRIYKLLLMPFGITPVWFADSWLYEYWAYKKIKNSVMVENPDADYCFFVNYLFYNKYNNIPSLLLGDWPEFVHLCKRGNSPLYKRVFFQEKHAIETAKHVISIFQVCAEDMKNKYPKANIHFLGGNVINNLCPWQIKDGIVQKAVNILDIKEKSQTILFIGKPDRYKTAAKCVVDAYKILKQSFPNLKLNIIGITDRELNENLKGVSCYGYLHKDNDDDCKLYYHLLIEAKVIVNPNPKWAAYSSMIEAMFFYTPVVVSPYDAFVAEFGKSIEFGVYNEIFSSDILARNIKMVIENPNFKYLCKCAHEKVENYSWVAFVDKIFSLD